MAEEMKFMVKRLLSSPGIIKLTITEGEEECPVCKIKKEIAYRYSNDITVICSKCGKIKWIT